MIKYENYDNEFKATNNRFKAKNENETAKNFQTLGFRP